MRIFVAWVIVSNTAKSSKYNKRSKCLGGKGGNKTFKSLKLELILIHSDKLFNLLKLNHNYVAYNY